ncbi:MAG: TonB-dependent receptor [Bacteroidales bacterium]|nr:TonB-dependent receptor [Bacteroidales bacterium]MCI1784899.1 TonB-dependent receptor [Bacteroidales bacterium]
MTAIPLWSGEPVKVHGKVTEAKSGDPIPGAVIRLDDDYLWAVTGTDGSFTFDKVEQGTYDMEVSCLGYVTVKRKLAASSAGTSGKTSAEDIRNLTIKMNLNSLALSEVVVTAKTSRENINTTQSIGRTALNQLQLSDMSGIASLLPGGKTVNPDLTSDNILSLRSGGTTAGNASFGTAVEVDGVRMGDNANFNGMSGIGTRNISVEDIESVEVITGVPSAEYGDLNSGMVKVTTKKGRTPVNVVFSVNPRTYETSVSKGFDLGGKKGILNASGEWTKATKKLTSPYTSYTRRGFTFDYSNIFNKVIRLDAGITGNIGGMNSKDDPDSFSNEYERERDNVFTPHFKAVWLLNRSWVTNLTLDGSIYYHDQRTHNHEYNTYGSSQPAVHSESEGYYAASELPLTYYSDEVIDSKELDYAASLKYDWLHHWNSVKSVLKAGAQWKADGNIGKGEYYEDDSLAPNGYRPRPYSDYPYMHNLAFYLEDNLTFPIGKTSLALEAGLRFENVFIKDSDYNHMRTLSPRFNAKWKLSDNITLRGGWGITEKLPSFYILYPKQEYRDIQTFGYSYGSTGSSSYVYYTRPYTMTYNPDLKWQKNLNSEFGIDAVVAKTKISLVGYYNVTKNPYEFANVYTPFSYSVMSLPSDFTVSDQTHMAVDNQTGTVYLRNDDGYWEAATLKVKDRTFANSRQQSNGGDVKRMGIELTADFPEIKPILTRFRLDASYGYTKHVDQNLYYYYNNGWSHTSLSDRSYQYVGIYAGSNSVYNGKKTNNMDANITAITHIPRARLVITCRLEAALMRHSRNLSEYNGNTYAFTVSESSNTPTGGDIYDGNSYTAVYPVAYMDLDGNVHPFTSEDASDPEFSKLIVKSANAYIFAKDGYDPYMSANLSVTKEIGDHVSISFFANNFTNSRRYVKSYATGVSAIFTPDFYYGLTCRLKF